MKTNPRWPLSELVRRQPHPSMKQRRQRYWRRKKARPSRTTPPRGLRRWSYQQKIAPRPSHPRRHPTHLQLRRRTTSTTTRFRSTRGRRHNRRQQSHRHLSRRPATAAGPVHQEQQPPKAERNPRGQAPTCHRAGQGAPDDTRQGTESSGARARNRAHVGRGPVQSAAWATSPAARPSRRPIHTTSWPLHSVCHSFPRDQLPRWAKPLGSATPSVALARHFRAGTYPKYNNSTGPTQYIMSY
jgi:hypothetical protein